MSGMSSFAVALSVIGALAVAGPAGAADVNLQRAKPADVGAAFGGCLDNAFTKDAGSPGDRMAGSVAVVLKVEGQARTCILSANIAPKAGASAMLDVLIARPETFETVGRFADDMTFLTFCSEVGGPQVFVRFGPAPANRKLVIGEVVRSDRRDPRCDLAL